MKQYVMLLLILFDAKNNLRSSLSVSQQNFYFFVLHRWSVKNNWPWKIGFKKKIIIFPFFTAKSFFCNLPMKDEKNKVLLRNIQTGPQIVFGVKNYQNGHNILFPILNRGSIEKKLYGNILPRKIRKCTPPLNFFLKYIGT